MDRSRRRPEPQHDLRASLEESLLYSEELGIDLAEQTDEVCFLWFLASLLFGGRISETIARKTWRAFLRHGLSTPEAVLKAGWDFLVFPVMREGGYVRYDGRKSTQVLADCRMLINLYEGRLLRLADGAATNADLEARLRAFPGIGPVTANIFLRELRPYWAAADPEPLPVVVEMARALGLDIARYDRKSVVFTRVEAGLIRYRHSHRHSDPGGPKRNAIPSTRRIDAPQCIASIWRDNAGPAQGRMPWPRSSC